MKIKRKRKFRDLPFDEKHLLVTTGLKILAYLPKKKRSVESLAYEAGVSKGYLYDLVKGKANPSLLILHRIALVLEVQLTELIGGTKCLKELRNF